MTGSDHVPRWFAAMRRGDFSEAWQISDRILAERTSGEACWHLPRHEQWVWDGRPLQDQRVLVRCYHGLGDTIQFARCLPMLDGLARKTIVWVQAALMDLLATVPGERQLIPLHDGTPDVEYDVDIEIMELGHALRLRSESLGQMVPYFDVPPGPRASSNFTVGLVATAGDWDGRRSVPAEMLLRIVQLESVQPVNLQLVGPLPGITDLSTPDVLELAKRIRGLDLVIAPDTMVAHLAGALAVPTWTLLPFDADWRWLQSDRADSPWYPTMRLFRQRRPGDWPTVVDEVVAALLRLEQCR